MKRTIYVVCLVALLGAILVMPAASATTWYVDDSGGADFTTIQAAVNASTDGDTIIVRDGTYIENVVVNKRLTIRSENGSELTTVQPPEGYYTPIFKLTADFVNIRGFTVNGLGPLTYDPDWVGKALSHGIAIDHANHCTIGENTAICCAYGIHVGWYTNNNTVLQNNCSGNRDHGIKLDYASDNTISQNLCRGTWHDDNIDLTGSTNNVVSDNICIDGLDDGIYLWSGSSGNMIVNNTCENNAESGIHSFDGGNIVSNNTCRGNGIAGINLVSANSGNIVTYNTVVNNNYGLGIGGSNGIIYLNTIIDSVGSSEGNTWNSTVQLTYTYNSTTYTNSLGNYWATYTGNDTDGDGIGDTPFYIEGTQYDYRPLMEPVENYSILTSIAVSPASATLNSGMTQQFTATAYDQTHEEMPGIVVTWTSSNETAGTVTATGLFAANATGTTTVTAAHGTVNGTATVTVIPTPILWGPYVTKTTTNATVINWKTENATTGSVQYATDAYYRAQGAYEQTIEDTEEIQLHHLNLTNLTPDTVYHYQVCIGSECTGECTFRTFPLHGSFTFIVYGDSQEPQGEPGATQLTRHKLVADRIAAEENVTFVLHVGDLVNDGSDLEEWTRFFEAARAMMGTASFYTTLGNHEYAAYSGAPGDPEQNYYDAFGVPEWYSFDCGNAHFTVLDSNDEADVPTETAWLLNDLDSDSAANASWKFVSFHHPPYSSSAKNYGGWTYFRGLWCPLFINHGVNAVFNGHVHAYERLKADGIHYLVVGTGGGPIYDLAEPRIPESQNSLEWALGYVKITVDADAEQARMEMIAVADLSSGELELYPPHTVFESFTSPADEIYNGTVTLFNDTFTWYDSYSGVPHTVNWMTPHGALETASSDAGFDYGGSWRDDRSTALIDWIDGYYYNDMPDPKWTWNYQLNGVYQNYFSDTTGVSNNPVGDGDFIEFYYGPDRQTNESAVAFVRLTVEEANAAVYFEPDDVRVPGYCNMTTVGVWVNPAVALGSGKLTFNYTYCCANVTDFAFNTTKFDPGVSGTLTTAILTPGQVVLNFATGAPEGVGPGPVHIGDATFHCCRESGEYCETDLTWVPGYPDSYVEDSEAAEITPVFYEDGIFRCNIPDLVITSVVGAGNDTHYTVTYTIRNIGAAGAPAGHATCLSIDGALVETKVVPDALAAGEERTYTFDAVIARNTSNPYDPVLVCADCEDDVLELDEENNCKDGRYPAEVVVSVLPALTLVQPQDQFDVKVHIDTKGQEILGVQYVLTYDTNVLRAETQTKGPFLGSSGETMVVVNEIDQAHGVIEYAETRKGDTGVIGEGNVATIHFIAIGERGDSSPLVLSDVIVVDENKEETLVKLEDGMVNITENQPPIPIGQSKFLINNVAKKYQSTAILCSCSYDPDWPGKGGNITYIRWAFGDGQYGTSEGLPVDNCTCKEHKYESWLWENGAYLPFDVLLTVTDDGCPEATNSTEFPITVYIAGDANGDGEVNILDAVWVGKHWRNTCPATDYCENCEGYLWFGEQDGHWAQKDGADLNNDCEINILDAVVIGANWRHVAWE